MVDNREVKAMFLLADAFKEPASRHEETGLRELERVYDRMRGEFFGLGDSELDRRITWEPRRRRYSEREWHLVEVELKYMGVWPGMRGLDKSLTIDSAVSTANLIRRIRRGESICEVPRDVNETLISMQKLSRFLLDKFPLIVFRGSPIRSDHNRNYRQPDEPMHSLYGYDIDDGSTRSVAYALNRIESVKVYVGIAR